jgi:DNA topoisomerase-1
VVLAGKRENLMKQMIHNGILIPKYKWKKLHISIKGNKVDLSPEQEEMALSWMKKQETDYVKDKMFVRNFFKDFCKEFKMRKRFENEDFDFSEVEKYIQKEKSAKLNLSKEEKKRIKENRKKIREANKEKYGYAIVDGVKTEVGNYSAEPSSIFMGRGKHPLRGRWKKGPNKKDIILNLSPDAPIPEGDWKKIVWEPNFMWIAKWNDKLQNKMKYVWLAENSILKQNNDIEKFNKAIELKNNILKIKKYIIKNLDSDNLKRRKTATVCYLIDKLKIRVGDEKDPDEADTVGASTLRPEHINYCEKSQVIFNFLGKDSILHVFKVELSDTAIKNLKEFSAIAKPNLFDGVDSRRVSEFLDEIIPGLSAKVFRTYYASKAVERKLNNSNIKNVEPDYAKKYIATMANLEAAKICNHRRTIPKTWALSLEKKQYRLKKMKKRAKETQKKLWKKDREKSIRYKQILSKEEEKIKVLKEKTEKYKIKIVEKKRLNRSTIFLSKRIKTLRKSISYKKDRIKNLKIRYQNQKDKIKDKIEKKRMSDKEKIEKLQIQIKSKKETCDYNLGTSLKSYIDPRIYNTWGKKIKYDWKLYYPKTLQKKFSWIDNSKDARY